MVTQFHTLTPKQAIEMIEAAGVQHATKLIGDHAAAGLVKTYAQVQLTMPASGQRDIVRDAAISPTLWERMIDEGVDSDAWGGGTVRLSGSDLIGGSPAVHITGITFNPGHIERLAMQQRPYGRADRTEVDDVVAEGHAREQANVPRVTPTPDVTNRDKTIRQGAQLCTIAEAGVALGVGRTTVNKLISAGKLVRAEGVAGTRITVASVEALIASVPLTVSR